MLNTRVAFWQRGPVAFWQRGLALELFIFLMLFLSYLTAIVPHLIVFISHIFVLIISCYRLVFRNVAFWQHGLDLEILREIGPISLKFHPQWL